MSSSNSKLLYSSTVNESTIWDISGVCMSIRVYVENIIATYGEASILVEIPSDRQVCH